MSLMLILYCIPFNLIDRASNNCFGKQDFPGELGGRDETKSEFSVVGKERNDTLSHILSLGTKWKEVIGQN